MRDTQLLVRHVNDGYFSEDIQTEVRNGKVKIRTDHGEVRQFEPCEFRLEFLKAALKTAYARQEWICRWTFTVTNGPRPQILTEEGWVVTHYFQQGTGYELKISICQEENSSTEVWDRFSIASIPFHSSAVPHTQHPRGSRL
jgi:hypothetical protein